ncbi:MAG: TetR/AcrR family transcriptional regulator [Pseudomonadota bacterium]
MLSSKETNPQIVATQIRIRTKAEQLFGHYGFAKTSVSDIARACDMSTGNIYRFYRNKQAIGLAVVENFLDQQHGKMLDARHAPRKSAETRLRAAITAGVAHLVETMAGKPRIFEMAEFLCDDPEGDVLVDNQRMFLRDAFAGLIAEGIETGEFSACDPTRQGWTLLLATSAFWMPQALVAWHRQDAIMSDLDIVLSLILTGMKSPNRQTA